MLWGAGGRFRCRACHNLAYSSTREGVADRHRRRADELRRRVGGGPGTGSVPEKPKGMHWATYERIVSEINARELKSLVAISVETDALLAKIERRYGPLSAGGEEQSGL